MQGTCSYTYKEQHNQANRNLAFQKHLEDNKASKQSYNEAGWLVRTW